MKELFQAVDIKKWAKKFISSTVIASLLIIDAAKAMEEEYDPRLSQVIHSSLSLKLLPTDQDAVIEIIDDFSPRQNSSVDEADSSTGSISASPEKLTPEGDKSLILSPFATFSLVFPQSNDASASQQKPDEIKNQPPSMTIPSGPLAFQAEEGHHQLPLFSNMGTSLGSSPMRAASLQERSPPFIPSQSVAESSNGQSAAFAPNLILSSANYDPLGSGSETESSEDTGIFILGAKPNIPRSPSIRIIGSKRDLSSAPVFSAQRSYDKRSKLLDPALNPRYYSIQAGDDDRRGNPSPSTGPSGDPEDPDLPVIAEDDSRCWSSCFNRPLWPEPAKYDLPDALNAIKKRSEFFLSPRPNHQAVSSDESNDSLSLEESDSSSPHGSPPKAERGDGILPSTDGDSDDPDVAVISPDYPVTYPAITDDERLINLQSPVDIPTGTSLGAPAHLSVLSDHDLEDGTASTAASSYARPLSPEEAWLLILEGINDLAAKIKARLKTTYQTLNGDTTWIDWAALAIAVVIGLGFAWAMGPVYDGGIGYLAKLSKAFDKFWSENASAYLIWYITYSALPDGIARNFNLWKKGITSLFSQEKTEIGRKCLAGAIAALTAFIPVAYLILAENIARERFQLPWDSVFGVAVIKRGIPLYIDALIKDLDIALNSFDKLEDGYRQFRQVFFPSSLPPQMKSFEAIQREKFDHDLTNLIRFVAGTSDEVIEAIYKDVQDVIAGARSEEDLVAQQAFAKICFTLSLADQVQEVVKKNSKKSMAELAFEGLKYFGLIFGAPTTSLLLQLVGSTVASLFTSNVIADSIGEGFALVAFLPFNFILVQSMDSFKNLVFNKDPRGHESHPGIRLPVKIFIGLQSLLYLFQTSVAVLQSYNKWFEEGWWPFAAGIPFFIPKLMGLAYGFNETFNEQVTTPAIKAYHWGEGKCGRDSSCSGCQRDDLIQFIKSIQSNVKHFDPELIHNLTKGIEIFKGEEANLPFEEI